MRHPKLLGLLTASGIFLLTALLIIALRPNENAALLLGLLGFFAGTFAGATATVNHQRRALGLDPALDEERFPKAMPQAPLNVPVDHLTHNVHFFN